jgi:tetratricopeptide (TPR) repeat protein
MINASAQHIWVTHGPSQASRVKAATALATAPLLMPVVDAHARLRGPYTAAGTIARELVPRVLDRDPALVRRYDIELLSAAPELSALVPGSRETLTSMAIPAERTRYYARLRTRRIANGLAEFLSAALDTLPGTGGPATLIVTNTDQADATDLEFLATVVRRIDPARLPVVVCSAGPDLTAVSPAGQELADLLTARAALICDPACASKPLKIKKDEREPADAGTDITGAAREYVRTEATSDDPVLIAAYQSLPAAGRAALHDRRADELAARGEQSLLLGPVPYHREHGSDPAGAGARALQAAQDYCVCMGFYEAAAGYGYRGLALADPDGPEGTWWLLVVALGLALSVLSRTREALALYDQARLHSARPEVHMAAAYSTAMLYTRHNDPGDRDELLAKSWLNSAIATASLIADPSERAFQSAFYRNGLALAEINLGDPETALRLVNECIDSLDAQLGPDDHQLHRSVLKNNRGRVHAALGRLDEALADYAVAIAADPNHAEHYLERGNILRRMGRTDEAAADYERAIALSPPFPEIYYNRGDLRLSLGDRDGARADFGYALELDPTLTDAYLNRGSLALEDGDVATARADAQAGLALDPVNGYLHVLAGQVCAAGGETAAALAAFDQAIAADPSLAAAWGGRAEVLFAAGDAGAALASLDRAVALAPDAALLFNRAVALEAVGRPGDALADLRQAAELDPDDEQIAERLAGVAVTG